MKTALVVTDADRAKLNALIADRNTQAKVVWRARIVLATADGHAVKAVCRLTGKSKPCVWRWQERFAAEGVAGLLRDKTRPPGRKPLTQAIKRRVLVKTASETPVDATHWSARTMAAEVGISHRSVQRIWAEAQLKPHLTRTFKVSNDPMFEEKVTDIVGLYLRPPARAVVGSTPASIDDQVGSRARLESTGSLSGQVTGAQQACEERMDLTAELVALVEWAEPDPGPEPGTSEHMDAEFAQMAETLLRDRDQDPLWSFAYGSLIWNPEFAIEEMRRARAHDRRRSFCLMLTRWRGTQK